MYPRATYSLNDEDVVLIDATLNLEHRGKVLKACKDKKTAEDVYKFCANGVEGLLYWINTFAWVYEPRVPTDPDRPFVLFDFQEDAIAQIYNAITEEYDVLMEKSRDMGATWMILTVYNWGWLFRKWDLRVGSRKQDYVYKRGDMAALMQKMEYQLKKLPSWMLPKGFKFDDHFTYNMLKNPEHGNSVVGEPTGPSFGVGSRQTSIMLDEFSYWDSADMAWQNTADVTGSRILCGIPPESKTHKFARIRFDKGLEFNPEKKSGLYIITMHWRKHPCKDDEWFEREKRRRSAEEIEKQLNISYEPTTVGRVYPLFGDQVDIGHYPYNVDLPLYSFWDYGEGGPDDTAIIWFQYDPKTLQKYIIAGFKKNYQSIKFFAPFLSGVPKTGDYIYTDYELRMIEKHKDWKDSINIGDPYNGNRVMATGDTIKKLLEQEVVYMNHKEGTTVRDRINKAAETFTTLHINNEVDSGCGDIIRSLTEARWPKVTDNRTTPVTKPVHDWTSHYRTAYEYGIDFWLDDIERHKPNPYQADPYYNQYGTYYRVGQPTIAA